ncbi:MAG: Holliday junction branch migration protein RuvA [Spirochaetes bacterium]|nr:Holliday junction branch migration protein RuvA [Spirochaetota bacterium]
MINFIKGILYDFKSNSIIIECSGVGYEIFCPLTDIACLSSQKGKEIMLNTYLVHKEDSMSLYGFISEKTKNGFLTLLKVGGIGPKAAIKILSHYDVDSLFESVEKEDIDGLKNIPGIGLKTAKKIIFDLKGVIPILEDKDKLEKEEYRIEKDLILALVNLGYKENDVRNKLRDIKPLSKNFELEFKRLLKKLAGK